VSVNMDGIDRNNRSSSIGEGLIYQKKLG